LAEYTTELINVINVLGLLVDFETTQEALLRKVCDGPLISLEELSAAGAFEIPAKRKRSKISASEPDLFAEQAG
jgi:hypothetical protein